MKENIKRGWIKLGHSLYRPITLHGDQNKVTRDGRVIGHLKER
jgi:hypothetical protein